MSSQCLSSEARDEPLFIKLSSSLQAFLFIVSDHICLLFSLFRIKILHHGIQYSCTQPSMRIFPSKIRRNSCNVWTYRFHLGYRSASSSFLVDKSLCVEGKSASLVYHVLQVPKGSLENTCSSNATVNWRWYFRLDLLLERMRLPASMEMTGMISNKIGLECWVCLGKCL